MVTKHCEVCGVAFTAKRSTARYCSNACRQEAYRRRSDPQHDSHDRSAAGQRAVATRYARHVEVAACVVCGRSFSRDSAAVPRKRTCSDRCRQRLYRDPVGVREGIYRIT